MVSTTTPRRPVRPERVTPLSARPGAAPAKPIATGGLTMEVATVTAAVAEEWLELNHSNRTVRKNRVAEFRRDMLANNWRKVGDPIRFDTNGHLIDGQHRLLAVCNAAITNPDIAFDFVVIRGVEPEDRHVIDIGTRRSASDQLKMAGNKNPTMLASAAKWCAMWDRKGFNSNDTANKTISHAEIMTYVNEHPDLEVAVAKVANSWRSKIDIPPGYVAAAYFLCRRRSQAQADEFFSRAADGIGLAGGDPVLALRSRLRDLNRSRANLSGEMWLSLLIRCWNAKRENRTLRSIPLYKGDTPIPCPPIK